MLGMWENEVFFRLMQRSPDARDVETRAGEHVIHGSTKPALIPNETVDELKIFIQFPPCFHY